MSDPLYSFDPGTSGPRGGPGTMVTATSGCGSAVGHGPHAAMFHYAADGTMLCPRTDMIVDCQGWPEVAGEFPASMLGGDPEPGPPYTHTLVPPEPIGEDEDGNLIYPEPGP